MGKYSMMQDTFSSKGALQGTSSIHLYFLSQSAVRRISILVWIHSDKINPWGGNRAEFELGQGTALWELKLKTYVFKFDTHFYKHW